jgi:rhodanese-related sulfurtransferase
MTTSLRGYRVHMHADPKGSPPSGSDDHPERGPHSVPSSVSPREAFDLVDLGATLLDVREGHEWATGHAPQAVHIPMSELAERAGELPADGLIVCVCHVGARSAMVTEALVRGGWQAANLTGGMLAWEEAGLPIEA